MKNGFTIIELIISIFILSVALVGIFTAFSTMVILTVDMADKLTASFLAQEGMEIVRNVRDSNWINISETNWMNVLSSFCLTGCVADYTTGTNIPGATAIQPWINDNNKNYLNINQKGFYNNGDESLENKPTKFKRKIIVTCLPTGVCANDYIMKVVVQVSWRQKASILNPNSALDANCTSYNCVTVESTLYDWYNYKDTHFKDTHL